MTQGKKNVRATCPKDCVKYKFFEARQAPTKRVHCLAALRKKSLSIDIYCRLQAAEYSEASS